MEMNATETGTNDPIANILRHVYRKIMFTIVNSSLPSIFFMYSFSVFILSNPLKYISGSTSLKFLKQY